MNSSLSKDGCRRRVVGWAPQKQKYQWKISKFDEKIEHLSFIRILVQTYIDKFHLITHIDPLEDYSVICLQKKPPIYNKTTRKRRRMIKNSDCWYSVSNMFSRSGSRLSTMRVTRRIVLKLLTKHSTILAVLKIKFGGF